MSFKLVLSCKKIFDISSQASYTTSAASSRKALCLQHFAYLRLNSIDLNGKSILSQKVHIGLTGLLSLFFGIDCWIRPIDGLLLRMKNNDINVVLIEEKYL